MWVVYSLIGILAIAVQTVSAQEMRRDTLCMSVYFAPGFSSVTSESELYRLDSLADRLQSLCAAADGRVSGILVKGWTSPEGADRLNERLSESRARGVVRYLADRAALPDSLLEAGGGGVDWQHLAEEASACPDLPDRGEVLRILENTPVWVVRNGRVVDGRKRRLGMLHGGIPYNHLYKEAFPALRRADIRAVVSGGPQFPPPSHERSSETYSDNVRQPAAVPADSCRRSERSAAAEDAVTEDVDADASASLPAEDAPEGNSVLASESGNAPESAFVAESAAEPAVRAMREPWVALKTNLLYDALLVPNVGIEFRFADRWSVGADYMHAWWSNDRKHRYWRCYGGEVTLRRYFGATPFTGHHVGIYGTMLTYDFEFSGKGWQSDGFSYGGGLEYGYSLPVARRLNLDFSIGVGYFGGRYKEYVPMDGCYVWQSTRRRHWFGPTRAQISLVWILGGERRSGKGGAR